MKKFLLLLIIPFLSFAQDCECILSNGVWENNDFMGNNPTLSGSGDNWELSTAVWISTELTENMDGVTNTVVYGADFENPSLLTGE